MKEVEGLIALPKVRRKQNKKKKEVKNKMTTIKSGDIIVPKMKKNSIDWAEMFDHTRFFTPAEIYISEKELAW